MVAFPRAVLAALKAACLYAVHSNAVSGLGDPLRVSVSGLSIAAAPGTNFL